MLLADVEHPRALALLRGLMKDPSPTTRAGAVMGLGILPDQRGLEAILELAVADPAPLVRNDACTALLSMNGEAVRKAIEALSRDPVESVAEAARQALAFRRKWGLDPHGDREPGP